MTDKGPQVEKLTFTEAGTKVLRTENPSNQLNWFLDLTMNTPR